VDRLAFVRRGRSDTADERSVEVDLRPWYVKEWGRIGWDANALPRIALIQLACVVLYVTPPTAVLGAVLLTGYLGGAISQYTRIGEPIPVLVPLSAALLAWAGLYLREERLRALLPFRRTSVRPN